MNSITDAQRVTTTNSDPVPVGSRAVRDESLPSYRLNLMRARGSMARGEPA